MASRFEQRVSLITLGVEDLARSRRFYERGLGFVPSSASVEGAVAFYQLGGVALGLFSRAELAADARVPPSPPGFDGITLAQNVRSREAVDQMLQAAAAAGATITKPAQATDWGGYHGYFADPDGHLWEVAHNPGFELLEDGSLLLPR